MHEIDLRRFDLNLLVVFDAVMAEGHVGRAGERLGLTQPAVSHALGRLRALLDDPLFVKHARGVMPTPRARALADSIGPLLRAIAAGLGSGGGFDPAGVQRTVVISGSDYIDLVLAPRLVARTRQLAPGFDLRFHPTSRDSVVRDLKRRDLDLAIGRLGATAAAAGIELTPLFAERLVMIARDGHPAFETPLTPEAFASLPQLLVSPGGDAFGSIDQALQEIGLTRRVAVTVSHFMAAPYIVGATDLVAVVAERVARRLAESARVTVHELPIPAPAWSVGLARLADLPADPAVTWLASLIAEVAAEL